MARHSRVFWEKLVAEVEGGVAVADVARRHRVRDTTLRWWRSHLRRNRRDSSIRLVAVETPSLAAAARHVEIVVGAAVLRVEAGTDVEYVAALARALGAAC